MKIVHLAIRVDDIQAAGDFYENVLGFTDVRQGPKRDHYSRHMTDGNIDIALVQYNKGADSREATAAGEKPCIHHFGMAVDDVDAWAREGEGLRLRDHQCAWRRTGEVPNPRRRGGRVRHGRALRLDATLTAC